MMSITYSVTLRGQAALSRTGSAVRLCDDREECDVGQVDWASALALALALVLAGVEGWS